MCEFCEKGKIVHGLTLDPSPAYRYKRMIHSAGKPPFPVDFCPYCGKPLYPETSTPPIYLSEKTLCAVMDAEEQILRKNHKKKSEQEIYQMIDRQIYRKAEEICKKTD